MTAVSRRLVVVVFLDMVGWTRLGEQVDPEPLQVLLEQYYEVCSDTVEEHGGVVEKFIGDAVMAVFGAERSREDDAVRALRAADRMRTDVGRLAVPGRPNLQVHCGVAAGEALVTHSSRAGLRVVGDVVSLAARLQTAAGVGEILVNDTVAHLAGRHFAMAPVPPLTLKGKAAPVPAALVTGALVTSDRDGTPMVDRVAERTRLRELYQRVVRERRPMAVTVLGGAGVGKTRLVREVIDDLGDLEDLGTAGAPVVAHGEWPSYGPTHNHVALSQVLDALAEQVPAAAARVDADDHIAAVLTALRDPRPSDPDGRGPGPGVEEVARAARELLAAVPGPVIVVWDGLEHAGALPLRLIGELITDLTDLPLLMICVARPELLDLDVPWTARHDQIEVGALTQADSAELATAIAHPDGDVLAHGIDLVTAIGDRGAGNPLFIRLLVESARFGLPTSSMPPTITAVVGAMLDRLPDPTWDLLGAASVIGPTFSTEHLSLLGEAAPVTGLDLLVDRQVIRPTGRTGEFRFTQRPVHEVAYGRLDKQRRLAWHRRLAEGDVSPAFHFEAAVGLLRDLRPDDPDDDRLADRAAAALLADGTTALRQRDVPVAIGMLDRALRLSPSGAAAVRYTDAVMLAGDVHGALAAIDAVHTADAGDDLLLTCAAQRLLLATRLGPVPDAEVDALHVALLAKPDHQLAWCRFDQLRMMRHLANGRFGSADLAARGALSHANAVDDVYEQDRLLAARCELQQWTAVPIVERLANCADLQARFAMDRFLLVPVLTAKARALALIGDAAGALAALAGAAAATAQLDLAMGRVLVDQTAGFAAALRGAHADAERHYRAAAAALADAGHLPGTLTMRTNAARERARQGDLVAAGIEIDGLLRRESELDGHGLLLCRSTAVRLHAADGRRHPLLAELLTLLSATDDPCLIGDVHLDLAYAYRHLGEHTTAAAQADAAIDQYAVIGATEPIRQVRAWL